MESSPDFTADKWCIKQSMERWNIGYKDQVLIALGVAAGSHCEDKAVNLLHWD
jgi:hypothetical protein